MILLERNVPLELLFYEAVMRRLPSLDVQFVYFQEQLQKAQVGYVGEQKVDFEWGRFRLPSEYFLLHDFQVMDLKFYSHQMDTVFLSPHFVLVLEIKNIWGKLYFNQETSQFIREREDGKMESFYNPIDQVQRHAFCLKDLLQQFGVELPIMHMVILANSAAILVNVEKGLPIFHLSGLQRKLLELYKYFDKPLLDVKELKNVALKLKKLHEPRLKNISLDRRKLLRGVFCEQCTEPQVMGYNHGSFVCPQCFWTDRNGLLKAMVDYRLLISNEISNSQFRDFFQVDSLKRANYLLAKFGLPYTGSFRNRKYQIPIEFVYSMK